jgi:hypothetical protein
MFEQAFRNIDDVLWKEAGCTTELDYTEQTSWLLFLKYLDDLEQDKGSEAALEGKPYNYILDKPYRWESWAALNQPIAVEWAMGYLRDKASGKKSEGQLLDALKAEQKDVHDCSKYPLQTGR